MVSRERILRHPKEHYQLLLDRLVALKPVRKWQKNKKKADGFRAAYVLEQAWCALNVSSRPLRNTVDSMAAQSGRILMRHALCAKGSSV